jgi:hypothetical protein
MKCPLCEAGELGRKAARNIVLGHTTPEKVAIEYNMSEAEVMSHINTHEIVIDDFGDISSPDFFMNQLFDVLNQLRRILKMITTTIDDSDKHSMGALANTLKLAIAALREIRVTVESAENIYGHTDRVATTNIQIDQVNLKYLQITEIINSEVCPECRIKITKRMEDLKLVPEALITTLPSS